MSSFKHLVTIIEQTHRHLQSQAVSAVNQALTIRNWLIGYYIIEFEQKGEDRAKYGSKLLQSIATSVKHIKGLDERSLRKFRQFYTTYDRLKFIIRESATPILSDLTFSTLDDDFQIRGSATTELTKSNLVPAEKIISKLSYTHLEQLINIGDPLKRTFYEIECIKGTWSVRELKRQINSLYFERSGLSGSPEKLAKQINDKVKPQAPADIIKNVYAFEFLNLKVKDVVEESDLENALLDNLEEFILELGNGFCLEGRQKRILIGDTHYFIDLVFYHRVLKCHVLIELKIGEFEHGDIGQLNTYLNFFKEELSEPNDNLPVGILLVAEKDHALVKYATAGMDKNLFVQKYMLQLPEKKQLENYLQTELKKLMN